MGVPLNLVLPVLTRACLPFQGLSPRAPAPLWVFSPCGSYHTHARQRVCPALGRDNCTP